jgi:hypothetical protein
VKWILLLGILFLALGSLAETQVAFIEIRDRFGNIHQLEPGGRFSHIAISYKGRWLHAHPYRGVEVIDSADLKKIGAVTIVSLPEYSELTSDKLKTYINKPYGTGFSWSDDTYYCSKLVGKILGMSPEPMSFNAVVWKSSKHIGDVGLSPDDIYRKIKGPHWTRCESVFPPLQ